MFRYQVVLHVTIDKVFKHFLTPTLVITNFTFLKHIGFERLKGLSTGLDFSSDSVIPAGITIINEVL